VSEGAKLGLDGVSGCSKGSASDRLRFCSGVCVPSASSLGRDHVYEWDPFGLSHSLQKLRFVFACSCAIRWARKVKVVPACSKFSAFSPADLQTGIPQWRVLHRSPGNDACAVREHPDKAFPLVTS